ncbi:MAG: translocation/assembly module TamB domain-containing protein, partial [Saprospiraceae bacterium]
IKNFAKNLTGYLSGNLAIKGNLENPQLTGVLRFKDASAFILATGTTYGIQTGTIALEDGVIRPNITLIDNEKRTASLQGSIRHEYFRKMAFDLQFRADNFTFLNSEKSTDVLFYGKFIADINADITGGIDLPKIRATITTRKNTDMTVQLISPEVVLNQESYMVFVDGVQNYTALQIDSIAQVSYHTNFAMDLVMNVNLTDDATMRIVTDPITGDNLEIKGNSQLVVKIPENGQLSITGIYEVKEGNYRFSYQNILKRDFALIPGSRIVFIGNPMDSRLDLKAKYTTQASTLPLIDNDISGLSDEETRALRKRAEVSILLSILGKLSSPELKFDIQIAEENSGPVGSSVTQALERLRANESDINREVFSILLFKSFSGNSSNGNITATGSATAVRSIGNLINSQLNKLTHNLQGFQLDFGLDQYQDQVSEGGGNVTQLDFGASQSLFKDRIVLSVGSNVDLESGNADREGFSSITGDFVLEYKLTESGKYRVKVFQKSDYDALNADNLWKTGVGFSYKTKFGKKKKGKKK